MEVAIVIAADVLVIMIVVLRAVFFEKMPEEPKLSTKIPPVFGQK
jgi:hypothetical protein